jgi:hypothetical protein
VARCGAGPLQSVSLGGGRVSANRQRGFSFLMRGYASTRAVANGVPLHEVPNEWRRIFSLIVDSGRPHTTIFRKSTSLHHFGIAMKYLCLINHEEDKLAAMSQPELDSLVAACVGWVGELDQGGHHIYSAGLQSPTTATTIRHQNGRVLATDGPFPESKEVLGGFVLIEARSLNEAIQLASKFPNAHLGSVTVRPVLDPAAELSVPLDRKIGAAFRRSASGVEPEVAARIGSIPQSE